jgi:carboxylesterase
MVHEISGCTVSGPLLPGHGTDPQDMNQTRWQDWFARVEEEIKYLGRRYSRVYVVGLSMGGLLALHAAGQVPQLKGVAAINVPIYTKAGWQTAISPILQYLRPYYPKIIDRDTIDLEKQGRFAYSVMPVKAFRSMNQLKKIVIKELPQLNTPMLLFQSSQDESVELRSAQFIQNKAVHCRVRLIKLPQSGHIATMGPEKHLIADEIAEFIKK